MQFAAALVTSWPKNVHHQEHLREAIAGAADDILLATNLSAHFGKSLSELYIANGVERKK